MLSSFNASNITPYPNVSLLNHGVFTSWILYNIPTCSTTVFYLL